MSQEEIEALMNATADVDLSEEEEIEEESIVEVAEVSSEKIEEPINEESNSEEDDLEDILAGIDGITEDDNEIEEDLVVEEEVAENLVVEEEIDNIDDIVEDVSEILPTPEEPKSFVETLDKKIDEGVYPLPVENEHKVVNQLNEVAKDSEEKVTQIFDVLSFLLDENVKIEKNTKSLGSFVEQQITILEALSTKFPKVAVLSENLALAQSLSDVSADTLSVINEENNQIFSAMELMQFNDINRQKIERVMAVIKKLTQYLNGIFEDDSDTPDVQIAKHISGDSSTTVNESDIDALISDFAN